MLGKMGGNRQFSSRNIVYNDSKNIQERAMFNVNLVKS